MTQVARDNLAALRKRSRAQWLFRALLEDEGSRSLSVVELCRRAGYTSTTKPWFRALNDEGFQRIWRALESQSDDVMASKKLLV